MILPFAWASLLKHRALFAEQWRLISLNGFLAMGICGTGVYWALKYTSATNGTLIYTSSPVLIIVMEWLFRGRAISLREAVGTVTAFAGVLFIIFKGSLNDLMEVQFNSGDLLFVAAAIAWAVYSGSVEKVRLQRCPDHWHVRHRGAGRVFDPNPGNGLGSCCAGGVSDPRGPVAGAGWGWAFLSSVLAFTCYQYGIRGAWACHGRNLHVYVARCRWVVLAVLLLGETFMSYHLTGLLFVMGGVILATFPLSLLKKRASPAN